MTPFRKPFTRGRQLLLMVAALSSGVAFAATCNSIVSGNWNNTAIWSCGATPGKGDSVTISTGTTVSLNGGNRDAASFTIAAGGTLNDTGNTVDVNGDVIVNGTWSGAGGGSLTMNSAANLSGAGTVTGNVVFNITRDVTVLAGTNLTFTDAVNGQIAISGARTLINNGIVTVARVTGANVNSAWTNAASSTLNVRADLLTTGTLNASAVPNTVNYSGAVAQAIKLPSGGNYYNLSLAGSNTKTPAAGTYNILGNFLLDTGVTYADNTNNPTVNMAGKLTDNGTFNSGTGTYTFNGTAAQEITGTTAVTTFGALTLNNANGLSFTGTHSVTVSGTTTLTSGKVTTNANVLYLSSGGAIVGAGATNFVVGNLKKRFATGANVSQVFEVGTEAGGVVRYAPVSTLTFGSVTTAGDFTVSTTPGDHPNIGTSTLDPAKSVNRYWTLTNNSVVFTASASNQMVFTFVAGDIDGGANTVNFLVSEFSPALPATGSWTEITPSARTGTTTTISGAGITTATVSGNYQIGEKPGPAVPTSFNAFETSTTPNPGAITGRIYTKLAGTGFSIDVVAISGGAQQTTFTTTTKKVLVDLVTGSTGGDNCPGTPVAVAGTSRTMDLVNGRSTTASFTVASALRDVRVRMRYPDDVPTVTACSSDNFSIRPTGFTSVTATSSGTSLNNSDTSGNPIAKAGTAFTITAVALAAYDGTPAIDSAQLSAHIGAVQVGALSGNFTAANSTTGSADASVTYAEVGNFTIGVNGVFDSGFTSIDQAGGDCTNDFSNTLVGGKYGCRFGNTAVTAPIGRFTPDHFDVDLTTTPPLFAAGCVGGGFTYLGQSFGYGTQPRIYITAKNAANVVTKNYTGASWWKITNSTLTARTYAAQTGTLDTSGLPSTASDPTIVDTGNGTGTLTFSSGTGLIFTRTTPVAPFNAELTLSINVIDADDVSYASNPARFGQASAGNGIAFNNGKATRFGRLAIANRSGSQLLPLPVPVEAQYWNGTSFITNTLDSCTSLAPGNVAMGSYAGSIDPSAGPPANCKTIMGGGGALTAGRGVVQLSAPAGATTGSVTLTVNLGASPSGNVCTVVGASPGAATTANRLYLQGNWTGGSYDQNPTGRASFGVYRGAEEVIYMRENF